MYIFVQNNVEYNLCWRFNSNNLSKQNNMQKKTKVLKKHRTANIGYTVLPAVLFIVFGILSYFIFNYAVVGNKHIDGTQINWYEPYIVSIGIGLIGFCSGKLIYIWFIKPDINNDGYDDMDGFPFGAF